MTDEYVVAKAWELHQGTRSRQRRHLSATRYLWAPDEDRDLWPFENERLAAERGNDA